MCHRVNQVYHEQRTMCVPKRLGGYNPKDDVERGNTASACCSTCRGRCREGDNRVGGLGIVASILPNFFYDIKYAVGGVEKSVDGCFVDITNLVSL